MPIDTQNNTEPETALRFAEHLENGNQMPNSRIVRMIDEKTFPFSENRFYSYNPSALAADEFKRCAQIYTQRANGQGPMQAMQLMQELMTLEAPHREELTEIAIEIVREMYNVPDSINLRAFLENSDEEAGEDFDDNDAEEDMVSDERKEELKSEIEKEEFKFYCSWSSYSSMDFCLLYSCR